MSIPKMTAHHSLEPVTQHYATNIKIARWGNDTVHMSMEQEKDTSLTIDHVKHVVDNQKASVLSLSKGGWEGWLQCELWYYLTQTKGLSVERELPYPNKQGYCDLVVGAQQWIEVKAFGIFREVDANIFLNAIAKDVDKLQHYKPQNSSGLVLVVVPKAIGEKFQQALVQRKWVGFNVTVAEYSLIYSMSV